VLYGVLSETSIGQLLIAGILVFLRNFISAYTERWLLQFRAEAFNLTNTPIANFANTSATASTFGARTSISQGNDASCQRALSGMSLEDTAKQHRELQRALPALELKH
jgi:hypothetical protein